MLADLDLLLTAVFCTADDLLPEPDRNARRRVTDAEVVTLCVAQQLMNISSDREFLAAAAKRLGHLFPQLPKQPGLHKRRRRLAETIEWLCGVFAADSPGHNDQVVLLDSTPVECGRSVETARRSELADACGYGYCRAHSRWFWGMRLHLCCAPDGTPRAAFLAPADQAERDVALRLLAHGLRGDRLRQGLRGQRLRGCLRRAVRRARPAAEPQERARQQPPPPVIDPPTDRIRVLDIEGPARPRAPPRPHPPRPPRPHRRQTTRPRSRRLAQPHHRQPQPLLRHPRRLNHKRGINHLGL